MLLENKRMIILDIFKKFIIFFNMCFFMPFFKIKLPIINKSQSLFYIIIKFYTLIKFYIYQHFIYINFYVYFVFWSLSKDISWMY